MISLWAGWTIAQQGTLIYLLAFQVLLAGGGRLLSIAKVGIPELVLPIIILIAHSRPR